MCGGSTFTLPLKPYSEAATIIKTVFLQIGHAYRNNIFLLAIKKEMLRASPYIFPTIFFL